MDFFFLYIDLVFFFFSKIKNNKIKNEKKFINVKLYGEKLSVVIPPNNRGARYIIKNLLFNNLFIQKICYFTIEFKILFSNLIIFLWSLFLI